MRKRLSGRLLSVILTIAICATAVFGCLMTASAVDPCYSFSAAELSDDMSQATIDVTFTAPDSLENGFVAGVFGLKELNADASDYLTIKGVEASGVNVNIEGNYVVFDTDSAKSTLTFELTFGFSKGTATKDKQYKVQLSEVELAYSDSEYYVESATGAIATISTECEHVIAVVGDPIEVDTANNYSVYASSVCTICGETFGKQLVPTAEKLGGVNETSTAAHKLYGSSVTYNDDGTFDFNLHFVPQFEGMKATLYVGTYDTSKFYKLESTESSYRDELGEGALMFTLKNISARDIDKIWMPTIVVEGGANVEWGLTQPVALIDNAKAVLEGDYTTADKKVSAALINYGTTAKAALAETTNDYSAGTIDLLEFGSYLTDMGSTSQWYDTKLADNGETGADWDNAIIIDSAEELVYLCKASGNDTAGKYYKVADDIAGFNLSTDKLDINGTLAGNSLASGKTNLDIVMGSGKNHTGNTPGFQGHFDGNGATVYGAWTNHESITAFAGLFSCTQGDVTIKNVHVKLSSFTAKTGAGGIVGYYKGTGNYTSNSTLTIENCSVTDSHLEITEASANTALGAIVGRVDVPSGYTDTNDEDGDRSTTDTVYVNNKINVTNCYVNLDEDYFISASEDNDSTADKTHHGGVVAYAGTNAVMVSKCIVIGVTPYPVTEDTTMNQIQHTGHANNFSNVYTDQTVSKETYVGGTTANGLQDLTTVMTQLTTEQLTGVNAKANMPALDWNNVWTTTNGYPTFINKDYKAPASGVIATWDGTVATGFAKGDGSKENPYIISTAAEFAYMVKDKLVDNAATITVDKYFKVADGISAFVMQKPAYAAEIMALSSAAETKAYFEKNAANMLKWPNYGWEGSSFCGHFDGNGATVYGLYQTSGNNAGLFSSVDAGAAIQNIGVKNSYLTSSASNYQVAAIAPVANSSGYGAKQEGVVWVNGCTVANNYMYNACTSWERSGVIAGGFSNDIIMIDNCLVYGNDATYGAGVKMALTGVGNNDVETTAKKPAELPSFVENSGFYCNTVRNSIILDCDALNTGSGRSYRRNE